MHHLWTIKWYFLWIVFFVKWFFLFLTISYSKLVRIDTFPMTNMIKWRRHVIYLCVWMSSNLHYCWDRWSFEKVSTQGIFSQWKLDQKITFEIHIKSMKNNSFWTWFCWRLIPYWEQRANFEEKSNISIHFSYFHNVLFSMANIIYIKLKSIKKNTIH